MKKQQIVLSALIYSVYQHVNLLNFKFSLQLVAI